MMIQMFWTIWGHCMVAYLALIKVPWLHSCAKLQFTGSGSWLPRGLWARFSQDSSNYPKILDFLDILGRGLPGSKQSPLATQLSREYCGGIQLTCSSSQLPGGHWAGPLSQNPTTPHYLRRNIEINLYLYSDF